MGALGILRGYNKSFWLSNTIELFERWAWYGFYMILALFLVNSQDTGALGLSQAQKGIIMGTGSMLLYILPLITGAIADKIGYKKVLYISFALYASGFYMMRTINGFEMAFFSFIWICVGGAFFKPIITAMIAKNTNEKTASIGFGIFYMMVNMGGFIGPFVAGIVLKKGWDYVFFMSIIVVALNFLITLFFFKEPIEKSDEGKLLRKIGQAFYNIWITLLNWKYVLFLFIMSLFWGAYNQLYYSFPVFVEQWVDTNVLYDALHSVLPGLANAIGNGYGGIATPTFLSVVSFYIICFQIMVSAFVMRFRPLKAMMGGIFVLAIGSAMMFSFQSGWIILLGLLIFGLGEMGSSPKFTEYVGRIAPNDKKALYLGSSYIAIGLGHIWAGILSGELFERISDKVFLIQKEVATRGIQIPKIDGDFTKNNYIEEAASQMNMSVAELSDFLWMNYQPQKVWMVFSGVTLSAVILLWFYDRFILKKK